MLRIGDVVSLVQLVTRHNHTRLLFVNFCKQLEYGILICGFIGIVL